MRKSLVIVAHPNLDNSRVNKIWLNELTQYPDLITINDLYANYPDFQINVMREQQLVEQHDRIIFQFPFYWYSSPPLLKKWMDDVLTYGWAFTSKGSKLRGKELALAISIGGSERDYSQSEDEMYTINELLSPFHATSNLIETIFLEPFTLYSTDRKSDAELQNSAKLYANYVNMKTLEPFTV
ncbi:NAD(P)H-dependent oxidoreductase [Paenibacillus glycanilyticus]|uniref:NAD(P)H-dependent oxidoreductase n=1 Tax=Paenibacillus glycanilyticus TaxID=126569 RepID=UPI00203DC264|nr:NAD(P)H-dependent oxidoreductase [Paenibacillus glycanilyticus]MCM3631211.1 NAD(P)H-dependent oxidoreductase [Paenibacillus glycanilyticus]